MLEPDRRGDANETRLEDAQSVSATAAGSRLIRLDWEHFLRHSRLEPMIRKMFPDQRKHERFILPHVVGYLGRAHGSRPHKIANISVGGFCMLSDELWTPGTEMPITLQREEWDGEESQERVSVQAIVVRHEPRDGQLSEIGFSIVLAAGDSTAFIDSTLNSFWVGRRTMEQFLEGLKKPKPPRLVPEPSPLQAPLPLVERTQRLLELARTHSVSTVSQQLQQRP